MLNQLDSGKVLIVDDDAVFPHVAARALSRLGFDVSVAHDPETALEIAEAEMSFAIVDLQLGDASGLDLIPRLKSINPAMRIVLFSGYASPSTITEAMQLGASSYLAKPSDIGAIVAALVSEVGS